MLICTGCRGKFHPNSKVHIVREVGLYKIESITSYYHRKCAPPGKHDTGLCREIMAHLDKRCTKASYLRKFRETRGRRKK